MLDHPPRNVDHIKPFDTPYEMSREVATATTHIQDMPWLGVDESSQDIEDRSRIRKKSLSLSQVVFAHGNLCALAWTAFKTIWLDEAALETALEQFLLAGQ